MAINPETQYVGKIAPSSAEYPYGAARNITTPGDGTGTPWKSTLVNDLFGFQQSVLRLAGIVPSGSADTALVSQYLQGLVELASGRAYTYDDSGLVDAYVLDVRANQQAPAGLFDGLVVSFVPGVTNTGAATVNAFASGVKGVMRPGGVTDPSAGDIPADVPLRLTYRPLPTPHWEMPANPSLLFEYEVVGAAQTEIDVTGLDIKVHRSYRVEIEAINATASDASISLYINGNTVSTNYYRNYLAVDDTVRTSARVNDAAVMLIPASSKSTANLVILQNINDLVHARSNVTLRSGASISSRDYDYSHQAAANITQLTWASSVANAIGIGTKIRIYRGDK